MAERIQEELQKPVEIGARQVFVSASMGIAIGSTEYASADDMMRDADCAMYQAKSNGKARHEFFGMAAARPVPAQIESAVGQTYEAA